ncbi:unnamed protein product [Blepharisma stoltei]|uniref:Uncharacterized protein n=1 Tax=Blepharisma stoltei TaxID=1481888 RepID=A0AAU9IGP4_9CILI|nr:unnamed protein product [Blepharisma stoltei]
MELQNRGSQILVIRIDLGNGDQDEITVYEEDEPSELASQFCLKHSLDESVQSALSNMIEHNIDLLIEEEMSKKEDSNIGAEMYIKGLQMKEKVKQEVEKARIKNEEDEMKEATFKPKINSSNSLIFNKAKHLHDCLKSQMQEIKVKETTELSFSPTINKHSKNIIEKKSNEEDKFLALYEEAKARDERKNKLTEEYRKQVYPFKPEVNELPRSYRSSSVTKRPSEVSNPPKSSERIQQIFQEQRINRYLSLFQLMNPTPEGKVTYLTIRSHKLPDLIANILSPLLDELEESSEEIDFTEFLRAMDALVSTLDSTKKAILLAPGQRWGNQKSIEKGKNAKLPMYERQLLKQLRTEEKIKEKRENLNAQKMKECTFQPQLVKRANNCRLMTS